MYKSKKTAVGAFGVGLRLSCALTAALCAGVAFAGNTSLDYVQTGLVAHWDAIDNQCNAPHDNAATTWVDLVGGRTFTLHNCTFDTTSLAFTGSTAAPYSYGELSAVDTTNTFLKALGGTVEYVFCYGRGQPTKDSGVANQALFQCGATNGPALGYSTSGSLWFLRNDPAGVVDGKSTDFGATTVTTFAVKYDSKGWVPTNTSHVVHVNKEERGTAKTSLVWGLDYGMEQIGAKSYIGIRSDMTLPFGGKLMAIRVYSRYLTAEEIAANYNLDQQRFVSTSYSPLSTTLRIVGLPAACGEESDYGDRTLASGETVQYTMPATYTDPDSGTTYRCTGWCLKDSHGDFLASGTGNVCDYTHPGAFRYLVWLWEADTWPTGTGCRYVATTGSDAETGADWLHAYKTVQKGIDSAGANGVVRMAAGTHDTGTSLMLTNDVSLVGCGRTVAESVLRLRAAVSNGKCNLLNMSSSGSVVTNLTLTNGGGSSISQNTYYGSGIIMSNGLLTHCVITNTKTSNLSAHGGGINMTGGTVRNCTITRCSAQDSGGGGSHGNGVYMTGGTVENCRIVNNGQSGSGTGGSGGGVWMSGGTLRGCLIARNRKYKQGSGVYAKGGTVENCTIVANTQNGANADATGARIEGSYTKFRNNILWANTAYDGVTAKNWSYDSSVKAANVYNNDSPTVIAIGSDNISANPNFVDEAGGDYHTGFSHCVDAGANQTWMATARDMDGTDRIVNGTVDIGCYEHVATSDLECVFSYTVVESVLDHAQVTFDAWVAGPGRRETMTYTWTFTRADGYVESVSGTGYAVYSKAFGPGTWDVRLDVDNGEGDTAFMRTPAAIRVGASVVYVSKTGTGEYPCMTPETATNDIDVAFRLLGNGGTLYVAEGDYVIRQTLRMDGSYGSRIIGQGPSQTSIRLDNVAAFTGEGYRGLALSQSSAYVAGVTVVGGCTGSYYSGTTYGTFGLASISASGAVITNCVFRDAKSASYGRDYDGMGVYMSAGRVVDCRFENLSSQGSGGAGMEGAAIRNTGGTVDRVVVDLCYSSNEHTGCSVGDVVSAEGSGAVVRNALVTRCTTLDSVPVGVANGASLINCTVTCNTNNAAKKSKNNLTAGVSASGSGTTVKNCIIVDNWSVKCGCVSNLTGAATYTLVNDRDASFVTAANHNVVGDPAFVDAATGDYHLIATASPAVNAGDWSALGETKDAVKAQCDLDGGTRLVGGIVDLGCYEAGLTPIAKPTAATGLVYDGTLKTGVASGDYYDLSGVYEATEAGTHTAYATPKRGYVWADDDSSEPLKVVWSIAPATYTWRGLPEGDWNNPANWESTLGGYPDNKNKTVNFAAGDWRVNVNGTWTVYDIEFQAGATVTLTGTGVVTSQSPIGLTQRHHLLLEGERIGNGGSGIQIAQGLLSVIGLTYWPCSTTIYYGSPLAMRDCNLSMASWGNLGFATPAIAPLYATNTIFATTTECSQVTGFNFYLSGSTFCLTTTKSPTNSVSLVDSTMELTNATSVAGFKNVTVADGASHFTATGGYEPAPGGTWTFVVPATGYATAPIQAADVTIPSGHKLAIDLSSVNTLGTNRLATATGTLLIAGGLSGLQGNATFILATGMKAELILTDDDKTLAVKVVRDLTTCTATVADIEYTGSDLSNQIQIMVTGTFGGETVTLTRGTDYDVTFTPDATGREDTTVDRTATITGKGAYEGTTNVDFKILGRTFVWVGGAEGNWRNEANWDRTGSGTGHGWPGDDTTPAVMYKYDIIVFTNGNYKVVVDLPKALYRYGLGIVGAKSMSIASDANVDFIMGDGEYGNVEVEECCDISSVVRIAGHATRPFPMTIGGHAYYKSYPKLSNELHLEGLTQCPWGSAIWFGGTTKAVLSTTGCAFGQGTADKNKSEFVSFYCENDDLPVVIAMTNTIWRTTCGPRDANTVGRNATWSYCNSTNLTGIIANHFGGALTLDNSVVGFQNLHGTDAAASNRFSAVEGVAEGDTFQAKGLAISGANTKFALSENVKVSGTVAFTMPAGGFANNVGVLNYHEDGKTDFNLDTTFAGVAPFAVATNLDLSAATLTVDAADLAGYAAAPFELKRYPLVRVGEDGDLTVSDAAPTVSGIAFGYVGTVEKTDNEKGLDLVVRRALEGLTIIATNVDYTGSALETVVVKDGANTLVAGKDYDIVYENNIGVRNNSVQAHATITGKGAYAGEIETTFMVMGLQFVWVGDAGGNGNWWDKNCWDRTGMGIGHSWPKGIGEYEDKPRYDVKLTNGTYVIEAPNAWYPFVGYEDDWGVDVTYTYHGYANAPSASPRLSFGNMGPTGSAQHKGKIRLVSYCGKSGYMLSGVGTEVPLVCNELHVIDRDCHTDNKDTGMPATGALGYGAANALISFRNSVVKQSAFGLEDSFLSICNDDNARPVRLALTNTTWISEFAASNTLGRAAAVTISHSTNLMGVVANRMGGSFTIIESLVAYNNVGTPSTDNFYGNIVYVTNLTIMGASTKFALSDNCDAENGNWHFVMPSQGFANDMAAIVNKEKGKYNGYYKEYAVTNLDVSYAGMAPVAVSNNLNLSAATLTVDAAAITSVGGLLITNYPLVRVGASGVLTPPKSMTVMNVLADYVGVVEVVADGKGLDLVIATPATVPVKPTDRPYTGEAQTGVPDGTGYTVAGGVATNPATYTATATLEAGYRWTDGGAWTTNVLWTILENYAVTAEGGLKPKVNWIWADDLGRLQTPPLNPGSTVSGLLASPNDFGFKYWEVYALGFTAAQAKTAAAVVQPVQTTDATKLTLKLGDWPATPAADSGVTVKYELHNAQTVGAAHHAIMTDTVSPQFDIPLSGWAEGQNVQYYRIRPVFENK